MMRTLPHLDLTNPGSVGLHKIKTIQASKPDQPCKTGNVTNHSAMDQICGRLRLFLSADYLKEFCSL